MCNPFKAGEFNGQDTFHCCAEDRISAVARFTRDQCQAALLLTDLQKTVQRAVRTRMRQLDKAEATAITKVQP